MAGRVQQDAFIDDSDESCPLCVEEFDLSDKNFRPCPCGYQVCQFCYNNIKNHMNGLCPACRRPYDDQSIEWKIVSPEEQKADIALQARKRAMAKKKESEQRQTETLNRKNLAGIRVVQKNLVYVVGLSQKSSEEDFLRTLRGPQYFGQYGKITKIVVSKAKEGQNGNNSIGVYVTFENKDDAARCIAAVDGSQNLDRPLRAQYGTTKYCSAFLRNETCGNRNCTFLHETGEDNDSFSRQDLSLKNAASAQRPQQQASFSKSSEQPPQPPPPPQQAPQSISAAPQSGPSKAIQDEAISRSDSGDGSALPSSASWAAKNTQSESRRSSKPASVAAPSPVTTHSTVNPQPAEPQQRPSDPEQQTPTPNAPSQPPATTLRPPSPDSPPLFHSMMKKAATANFKFTFDESRYTPEQMHLFESFPPLFDPNGGLRRFRLEKEQEKERQKQEEDRNVLSAIAAAQEEEEEEAPASGSLQLGGEPETQEPQDMSGRMSAQQRSAIQPPFGASSAFPFSGPSFQASSAANLPRTFTPQQQQHLSLLRSQSSRQSPVNSNQFQQGYTGNTSLHQHQPSNPFQMQNQTQAFSTAQGHARQASRFTFASDSTSNSTVVKPTANPQMMAQQAGIGSGNQSKTFQNQPVQQSNIHGNHFYSGVQGPPPGLKSSGISPAISGDGMFAQGHGFASTMGGSSAFGGNIGSKNSNEELMRELLRTRNGSTNGQGSDVGKQPPNIPVQPNTKPLVLHPGPSITPAPTKVTTKPTSASTPVHPGLSTSQDFPPLAAPSVPPPAPPRLQRKTTAAAIKPVVPVVPATSAHSANTSKEPQPEEPVKKNNEEAEATAPSNPPTSADAESKKEADKESKQEPESTAPAIQSKEKTAVSYTAPVKAVEKKERPKKLDIANAEDLSKLESEAEHMASKDKGKGKAEPSSAFVTSQPPTPGTAASQVPAASAVRHNQPRTIRIPALPKAEASSPGAPPTSITGKHVSRQPSLASINRPGTPASEKISDNASLTSATISRANSPPPSVVGSAPKRHITKSQQKKERQTRARQVESSASIEEPPIKAPEEEQAPIIGRKKKTKKDKSQGTADSTPTVTRPTSPAPKEESAQERAAPGPATPVKENKKGNSGSAAENKESETPSSPATPTTGEKRAFSLSGMIYGMIRGGELSPASADLFKGVAGLNYRFDGIESDYASDGDNFLSDEQIQLLEDGEAIQVERGPNNHAIMLSDRRELRGFSASQASRYLELRNQAISNSSMFSHQIFDSLIPAPPPLEVVSATQRGSKQKKLINRFDTPLAGPEPAYLRYGVSGLSADEVILSKKPTMSVMEAEQALLMRKKEAEPLEKKLNGLLKRNRRLLFGNSH